MLKKERSICLRTVPKANVKDIKLRMHDIYCRPISVAGHPRASDFAKRIPGEEN